MTHNDHQPSKFEALAGYIELEEREVGMSSVMSVPEPLYFILQILHDSASSEVPEVRALVDEIFEQMHLNLGPSFSFEVWNNGAAGGVSG